MAKKVWRAREHRNPPLPEWFHDVQGGVCRWCGKLTWRDEKTIAKRRNWHKECLSSYWVVTQSQYARQRLWERDKGQCAACGKIAEKWHADHIVRLLDAPRELKYWTLENIQTLCVDCHSIKTASENRK